jgi:methylenetetrahydrofolate dehydrogenase (NADP+) / methenyltetrahydrofolate cyclohydrolase
MDSNIIIGGGKIKAGVIKKLQDKYGDRIREANLKVEILRFASPHYEEPLNDDQKKIISHFEAAEDSRKVKTAAFKALGIEVVEREFLPQDMEPSSFEDLIQALNDDPLVSGIIVQYPVPKKLDSVVKIIRSNKDLDALSSDKRIFKVPATSEGIIRLVEPFLEEDMVVAVVGADGFVGRGVVEMLEGKGVTVLEIDSARKNPDERDLFQIKRAGIVISVTGSPGILDHRYLDENQVVIDGGYFPRDGEKLGDVDRSAVGIPKVITRVPGGVGPVEMGILCERIVELHIDRNVEKWQAIDYLPEIAELLKDENIDEVDRELQDAYKAAMARQVTLEEDEGEDIGYGYEQ